MDYSPLKAEIQNGTQYAANLAAGNFNGLAEQVNSLTDNGAALVSLPEMDNATFVTAFLPYLPGIYGLTAPKPAFYELLWHTILAIPVIRFSDPRVSGMLSQAVADELLTQAQATALNQRMGSRAEVLCGAGANPSGDDIAEVLRS